MCLQCSKFNFICDSHAALSEQTSLLLGNSSPAHTRRSLFWGWVESSISKEQGCYVSAILQVQFLNCQLIVRPKILKLENGCLRKNLNLVASEKSRILGGKSYYKFESWLPCISLTRIVQKKWLPKLLKHLDGNGGACDLWKFVSQNVWRTEEFPLQILITQPSV